MFPKSSVDVSVVAFGYEKNWDVAFPQPQFNPIKKGTRSLKPNSFSIMCGRYWIRTSDPLLVRQR